MARSPAWRPPWAEAVAIADGRFVAVGTNDEIDEFVGDDTEVTDLQGRMAMPGIFDIHIHPVDGSMAALYDCSFPFTSTVEQMLERVAGCVADTEAGEWKRRDRLKGRDRRGRFAWSTQRA